MSPVPQGPSQRCRTSSWLLFFVVFVLANHATALLLRDRGRTYGCNTAPPSDLPSLPGIVQTVIVVLGGPTEGTKPGIWLEWRLKAAMKVYKQHSPKTTAFLVTGGRPKSYGSCGAHSEAAVMQRWLENEGISAGVWREDRSNNTLDNAELSWHRLSSLKLQGALVSDASVHIVSQPWHMVKASECFKVFFSSSSFRTHYNSTAQYADETMVPFEQESYSAMYAMQLRNWLPWQLGTRRARDANNSSGSGGASESEHLNLIDQYVAANVKGGFQNAFFINGEEAIASARRVTSNALQLSSAWSHINELQWHMFKKTLLDDSAGDSFIVENEFSRWGSLKKGTLPRYVTFQSPGRDSGDLLGLSCPNRCGNSFDALRVVAFLYHPDSRKRQLQVVEAAEAWVATKAAFSIESVALFALRRESANSTTISLADVRRQLKLWNSSALSKNLDVATLELLAESPT